MSARKHIIRAAVLAGVIGATARGDAILPLGVFSSSGPVSPGDTSNGGFSLYLATTPDSSPPSTTASSQNLATSSPTNQPSVTPASNASYASPAPSPSYSQPAPQSTYDAFINLGPGPFANSNTLTTGNAQAWYDSSSIVGLFGGHPTAQQISNFDATVLQRVEQTFQLGGVPVTLTDNPADSAAHTLSVVSGAVNPSMGNAIGMTYIGGNGFHFIDNSAGHAQSVDQLEWLVAHNVAHELMLAFGVPEVHDQTGKFIDSTQGNLAMFLDPNATFSTGAVQDLLSKNFLLDNTTGPGSSPQYVDGTPVPEPATLAIWALGAVTVVAARRARSRRASA